MKFTLNDLKINALAFVEVMLNAISLASST